MKINEENLQQIFKTYIDRFEEFNKKNPQEPSEYYKWEMTLWFKDAMDKAITGKSENFASQLKQIQKDTHDFIDNSSTWPFTGLVKLAEHDGEKIQKMFCDLFAESRDLDDTQMKIEAFLRQAHCLEEQYGIGGRYKSDYHSVTAYLFLYDPNSNYVYKPDHAHDFQDCVDFYGDFGTGDSVNLKTYYQMCDQLVEVINRSPILENVAEIRSKIAGKKLHEDKLKHILAYDIIYCAKQYNLFTGITFVKHTATERKLLLEKQQKALELLERLKKAQEEKKVLDTAMEKVEEYFRAGQKVIYKSFGKGAQVACGIILKRGNDSITIDFGDGNAKTVGLIASFVNGYICPQNTGESDFADIVEILKKKSTIKGNLSQAEREFAPYNDYI